MLKRQVLIIEDNRFERDLFIELLTDLGYSVIAFDNAEEALYLLEEIDVPVIITDLKLPWMNGVEFCNRMKKMKPHAIIFALSGCIESFDKEKLENAGFKALLSKPVNIPLLAKTLNRTFSQLDGNTSQL